MKTLSIRFKVILGVTLCLMAGAVLLIALVRGSYRRNVDMVAEEALKSAKESYENLKQDRATTLAAATAVLTNVEALRQLFLARDRDGLFKTTQPAFEEMKKQGVIHLLYLDTEGKVVLRMHKPAAFGDDARVASYVQKAFDTKAISMGSDLVAAGFAIGSCRPYYDGEGKLIGFMIGGASLTDFLATMKRQTSDDYEMVGYKKLINEGLYHKTQQQQGLPDKWNQFPNVIVLGQTTTSEVSAAYEAELAALPAAGKLLGEAIEDGRTYVKGVFPMVNVLGKTTGGIFVRRDITSLYSGMQRVQTLAIVAIAVLMLVVSILLIVILNKLVFARLGQTMDIATRVVGGEFERQIVPMSDDEVGKLEALLEQFRTIFVGVVKDLSVAQQSDGKSNPSPPPAGS